jgi:hypothetical protein
MKSPLLRTLGFILLFTLISSVGFWFRDGILNRDLVIKAAFVGGCTAALFHFWNFIKAQP